MSNKAAGLHQPTPRECTPCGRRGLIEKEVCELHASLGDESPEVNR